MRIAEKKQPVIWLDLDYVKYRVKGISSVLLCLSEAGEALDKMASLDEALGYLSVDALDCVSELDAFMKRSFKESKEGQP